MARKRTESPIAPPTGCFHCTSPDQGLRHKHWLVLDDLATHLRTGLPLTVEGKQDDNRIANILTWAHTARSLYGGLISEQGVPLSAWDARQIQQRFYDITYRTLPQPRTVKGRQHVYEAMVGLLNACQSEQSAPWRYMLEEEFTLETVAEDSNWRKFCRWLTEYEMAMAEPFTPTEPTNTRQLIRIATPGA